MSREETLTQLHHEGMAPPPVCPCDTANKLDTQSLFIGQQLSVRFGSRHFKTIKHLTDSSKDSCFIDNDEYPLLWLAIPPFVRLTVESPWTVPNTSILTLFIWILPLTTGCRFLETDTHWSWLTCRTSWIQVRGWLSHDWILNRLQWNFNIGLLCMWRAWWTQSLQV